MKRKGLLFLKIIGILIFIGLILVVIALFAIAKIAKDLPNPELLTNNNSFF